MTRKLLALGLLLVLALSGCSATSSSPAAASPAITAGPTSGASSPTSAAATSFDLGFAAELQSSLEALVTLYHYPALSAAVILPDGRAWSGAAGLADVATGTRATPETAFPVGSITKTFVAALLLELAHDGVLSLDDPIAKWLPQLRADARFAAERVTIRELLDHTSGIADVLNSPEFGPALLRDRARIWTPDEVLAYVGSPTFAPGTAYAYSNTGYLLAGMIIERVSGSSLAALLRARILAPLGLERTVLQPQERPPAPVAHGYAVSLAGATSGEPLDLWDGSGIIPCASAMSAVSAAGGIASTASDLARWAAALYGGRVLDPGSLAEMLDFERNAALPQIDPYRSDSTYGLGAGRVMDGDREYVGHNGFWAGLQGYMWYATGAHTTVVLLTNTDSPELAGASRMFERLVAEHVGG